MQMVVTLHPQPSPQPTDMSESPNVPSLSKPMNSLTLRYKHPTVNKCRKQDDLHWKRPR